MQINQIDEIGNQLSNGSENYSPNPGILSRNGPIRQFIHNHLGIGPGPETPPVQQLPAPATPEVAQHAVATAQKLYKFNPNLAQDPRFKNLASTYGFNVNATPPPAAATPPVPPAAGVSKPISPPGNLANVSFKGGALPVPAISGTAAIPSPIPISKAPAVSGSMATPKPVAKPSPLVSGSAAPPGAAPAPSNDQLIKDLHRSGIFVRFEKGGADLSPGSPARSEVPKKDFVYKEKSPKGSEVHGSYPIPDEAHARAALGFAAMHHGKDSATYRAVASKVHAKFPEMGKKALLAAQPGMGLMVLLSDAMEKTAIDLPEVAGGLMVAGSVGGEADPSQAPKPPTGAHAKATQIDNRTGQIVTPDGNIVVDDSAAHDPQFRQRLNRLAVLMASAEARGNAV